MLESALAAYWILLTAVLGGQLPTTQAADAPSHPMDALSASESEAVIATLMDGGYVDEAALYPLLTLEEPAKAEVLRWQPGDPLTRRAFVIVKQGSLTFEGIVDIGHREVVSWERIDGVQPAFLMSTEWSYVQRLVLGNQAFRSALAERDITNLREIVCIPHTVGYFGLPEEEGRRLVRVFCFHGRGSSNFWGRPIEGLIAVVDLDDGKVAEIIDIGRVPVSRAPVDFNEAAIGGLRQSPHPISIVQPEGPSFELAGRVVSWQKWRFHFRIDPRLGLVVSTVRYNDAGNWRSILYQGSLSELFVPYMDPGLGWYFRTPLDAGEYGVGKLAVVLAPGLDCPENAVFFGAVFAHDWGSPYSQDRAACLFERYAGDIAWRHDEAVNGQSEVRRRTDLVLRSISAIGNYDYIFDWIFRQDGTIRVSVGASGVPQVKGTRSPVLDGDTTRDESSYGRMVAEHTLAVNHDHFILFRIDLDVDDPQNGFVVDRLKTERLSDESPRRSVWVVESRTLPNESSARLRIDLEKPALWRVINPNVRGTVGYPVSYQLRPNANAVSLLSADDFPQRRAGFTDYHLWVTPYHPRERYAAGNYPNQSRGGDGLPRWTAADRSIENRDIVLWYTLGLHHVVRAEDWPVMPTTFADFELRPFDFFSRNPAIDLPN